jgi:hypothetical protein
MIFGEFNEGGIQSAVLVPMALHKIELASNGEVIYKYPGEFA